MLQKTDIVAHFVSGCGDTGKNVCHAGIYFTGVGLSGYGEAVLEAHLFRNHGVNLIYFFLVSVKKL